MTETISLGTELELGPITINAFGDKCFFNLNRSVFDKVSAKALFDSKFGNSLFDDGVLNVVVGTDSGLLPRYVQEKYLPRGARYIFIEPDWVFNALNENKMFSGLDDRIVCVSLEGWIEALRDFKVTDYFYINAVRSLNAICVEDDYIQEYAELSWHITEVLSQLHWRNSAELGAESFIANQIANVADNKLPAILLEQAFQDKTVVLLAGGPSLDNALLWVRQHRNQIVVFAVSRISRQLLQAEIEPDFVFSVDPTELSFDISKEMLGFGGKTAFICSFHTVPTLLNQWLGPVFYLGARLPWDSALNLKNLNSTGPTVTNTALTVAHRFGFKRIVLAGVDLCFTKEGFTHAKGSDEHLAGPRFSLTSLEVETNDGFMAPTSCDFAQAILTLGLQAKQITSAGCQIINVSGSAAKVEGIEYMSLAEIYLEGASVDAYTVVAAKYAGFQINADFYQKTLAELKRARFQIKAIGRLAESARAVNDEMYNPSGIIENYKDKKKLDQIEKKFKREHRHFSRLVKKFGIRRFLKLTKPFDDEEWSAEEARQLGNVYYEAYSEGANKLLRLIGDSIDRVIARQEELSRQPDFYLLIEQTRKDRSYGRVRRWRKVFSQLQISPEVSTQFNDLEQQFSAVIDDRNTRHMARAKSHSDLVTVKKRAGLLFKHNKTAELTDLLSALGKHEQQEAAIPYRFLVEGYLAELENQFDVALESYQQIVDVGDGLLEEALVRIASIGVSGDDARTVKLALECLSQINPVYLPLYAEIQRLHGDVVSAIDSYVAYVSQFPQDVLVQMKLAALYGDCKIYDGAEIMLDYILQQRPNYDAAMILKRHLSEMKLSG